MRLLFLLLALAVLPGCGDGRWTPGYLVTADGEVLSNNADNMRAITIDNIVRDLDAQLGSHWRVDAAIAELPTYTSGDGRVSGWMWAKATATITLIGDGGVEPALNEAQITSQVQDYLSRKVDRPSRNLVVTTTRVVDATRHAARPAKPGKETKPQQPAADDKTTEKPVVPATSANRRYLVQAGDTWAELSNAFYGSSQHWRLIADANQGGELTTGREIVIPPKP